MADGTKNFVDTMLEKAKEKKETKPQTRYEGVDKEEVAQKVKEAMERLQKGKK